MDSSDKVTYRNIDISFDPHYQNELGRDGEAETSSRRKVTVDLVWRDLQFVVPERKSKEKKKDSDPPPTDLENPEVLNDTSENAKVSANSKVILHGVSGYVRPGTMLAVMGSSGAGKTTLLNLLAGRMTSSKGAYGLGEVYVNGKPRDYTTFKKLSAYVLQDDDMFAELTVEEQLTYAALLRLPADMPRQKKLARVHRVIQELGLTKVKNTLIGSQLVRGVSGGERKRVNIATELVTDPSLLFLDEPTTGLDAFNALNVMSSLRHLASNGRTVVSTIHQPRSSIFGLFDQLCLLSEGRVMYFGPAKDAVSYFAGLNFRSPSQFNPADFFLDLLSVDPRSQEREMATKARVKYLGDKYEEQESIAEAQVPSSRSIASSEMNPRGEGKQDLPDGEHVVNPDGEHAVNLRDKKYQGGWFNEFLVLCGRAIKLTSRERQANGARLGQVLFFAILLGLIWLRDAAADLDPNNFNEARSTIQSLKGILFFVVINQAFGGSFSVIFGFPLERSVVTRERAANTYRTSSYFLSKTITDIPKTLFFNSLFSVILYWMVGFRAAAGAFFFFILVIFLVSFTAESLALAVSIMTGDAQAAAALIPVFIIMSLLFGGFFISSSELDDWLGWIKYLSFIFYGFNALLLNEYGTLSDGPLKEVALDGHDDLAMWVNIAILFAIMVFFRLLAYLFLHYLRGPKYLKF